MPDWEVELTYTYGPHQTITKSVTVQDCPLETAKAAGIAELLQWGQEQKSIPVAAWDYWQECRTKPMLVYEVMSELQSRWNISFVIKQAGTIPPPPPQERPRIATNGASPAQRRDLKLKDMLAEQFEFLQTRQREIALERKRLDDEWADNADALAQIRTFLMITPKKRKKQEPDGEIIVAE